MICTTHENIIHMNYSSPRFFSSFIKLPMTSALRSLPTHADKKVTYLLFSHFNKHIFSLSHILISFASLHFFVKSTFPLSQKKNCYYLLTQTRKLFVLFNLQTEINDIIIMDNSKK